MKISPVVATLKALLKLAKMPETTRIWVLKIPLDVQKTTKVPGTVSRTKRSANFSPPQVKHFLGCKKITKSNKCGLLFTRSGALLF